MLMMAPPITAVYHAEYTTHKYSLSVCADKHVSVHDVLEWYQPMHLFIYDTLSGPMSHHKPNPSLCAVRPTQLLLHARLVVRPAAMRSLSAH